MPRSGSLPWLLVAAVLAIGLGIFLDSVLIGPITDTFFNQPGWRGSSSSYANDGMRMVEDFVNYLLVVIVAGVSFGVLLDARRRAGA